MIVNIEIDDISFECPDEEIPRILAARVRDFKNGSFEKKGTSPCRWCMGVGLDGQVTILLKTKGENPE